MCGSCVEHMLLKIAHMSHVFPPSLSSSPFLARKWFIFGKKPNTFLTHTLAQGVSGGQDLST